MVIGGLLFTVFNFIATCYNSLSIWFQFFLSLSCYLSPFLWENQFFFFNEGEPLMSPLSSFTGNQEVLSSSNYFFYVTSKGNLQENKSLLVRENNDLVNKFKNDLFVGNQVDKERFYLLLLEATTSRTNLVDFYCLNDRQIILAGETSLSFYRIYNKSENDILFYSVYIINPTILSMYLVKVQCFCFEEILINPGELINLPVLLYLDSTILLDNKFSWVRIIYLEYIALIKEIDTYL